MKRCLGVIGFVLWCPIAAFAQGPFCQPTLAPRAAVLSENPAKSFGRLRGTVVIVQQAADPLAWANRTVSISARDWLNQLVADALMISFAVVMGHELDDRATKMPLPQQNDAIEALLLDRPNEAFRVGVAVGCAERRANDPDSLCFKELQHGATPLPIAIADQQTTIRQHAVNRIRQVAHRLNDESVVGMAS